MRCVTKAFKANISHDKHTRDNSTVSTSKHTGRTLVCEGQRCETHHQTHKRDILIKGKASCVLERSQMRSAQCQSCYTESKIQKRPKSNTPRPLQAYIMGDNHSPPE